MKKIYLKHLKNDLDIVIKAIILIVFGYVFIKPIYFILLEEIMLSYQNIYFISKKDFTISYFNIIGDSI